MSFFSELVAQRNNGSEFTEGGSVVPLSESALEVLHYAVSLQKRGEIMAELWPALMNSCDLDNNVANRTIEHHSNTVAFAIPKLDIHDHRQSAEAKAKEHTHLLHALRDGACFTNKKLHDQTFTFSGTFLPELLSRIFSRTLFENEERLAAMLALTAFLDNPLLHELISEAGKHVASDWDMSNYAVWTSDVDRFFTFIQSSPSQLAEVSSIPQTLSAIGTAFLQIVMDRCQRMEDNRRPIELNDADQCSNTERLFEMMTTMFSSAIEKRHSLNASFNRPRLLAGVVYTDWFYNDEFHDMWDTFLYASTRGLTRVTRDGFRGELAQAFAALSIRIARRYCEIFLENVGAELEEERMDIEDGDADSVDTFDRYVTSIVDACFGKDKTSKAGEDISRQLMIICKAGRCYNAVYMLLYICSGDIQQLYHCMLNWNAPEEHSSGRTLACTVFRKWLRTGDLVDLEHLLKGPQQLDGYLVDFLKEFNRPDLASVVQMRMGDMTGSLETVKSLRLDITEEDTANQYLLSCTHSAKDDLLRKKTLLLIKLESIRHKLNLLATPADTLSVLDEVLYLTNHSCSYDLLEAAVDIFIYSVDDLVNSRSEQWCEVWKRFGELLNLDAAAMDVATDFYRNRDFRLLQKACEKIRLSIEERGKIFDIVIAAISDRCHEEGIDEVPETVKELVLTALDISMLQTF